METYRKVKTNDPQVIVTGHLKQGEKNDCITFSVPLGYFELICIVSVPYADATTSPVYIKWKINNRFQPAVDGFMSMISGIQARKASFPRNQDGDGDGDGDDHDSNGESVESSDEKSA